MPIAGSVAPRAFAPGALSPWPVDARGQPVPASASWNKKLLLLAVGGAATIALTFVLRKRLFAYHSYLGTPGLNLNKGPREIQQDLSSLVRSYEERIDALIQYHNKQEKQKDMRALFVETFGRLADADGHASLASAGLTLPALVSSDIDARSASSLAKQTLKQMWAKTYARADLYQCLQQGAEGASTQEEKRLVDVVLTKFRQTGATLGSMEERRAFSELEDKCASLAFQIEQNINEDNTEVPFTEAELEGCGSDFIEALPLQQSSNRAAASEVTQPKRMCSVKAPTLIPILRRATNSTTRQTITAVSQKRCIETNEKLLEQLITLRHQAAVLLGFSSHAERMISPKMAGSLSCATAFCEKMLTRLQAMRDEDLRSLRIRKQQDTKQSADVFLWDVSYYSDLLKREQLQLDDEKLKEFFPLEGTISRILSVYSEFLGLDFHQSKKLAVWHPEVVAYEVCRSGQLVGHLYLDQFPRNGKYGHQMVVPLSPSFVDTETGQRCVPACVNISNLPRAQGGKPALLRFSEMETLFHELGHAMHCLCTTTRFSNLSWAWPMVPWPGGVEQDFLELPSMALQKFAAEPSLLRKVAKHYTYDSKGSQQEVPSKVLGEDQVQLLKQAERWMVGLGQTRYFAMALFDLLAHSQAPPYTYKGQSNLSIQQLYALVYEEHSKLSLPAGAHPCASWYHLVSGYDAGYYGYGWSDVYAADVYDKLAHPKDGVEVLSASNGANLRDQVLGPCATQSGQAMLRAFLGREPNEMAWLRWKGVPE
eukprot:gb/GEZN01001093.1/.p1 GENE.gb/GEZN01001093.1/~~gb/GEZN01001093.1/.p1  ORF type:complete len:767 (-),score=118.48 gb/GEZN01001093.1/:742-3042(-)